jgi:hypothetical protein
MLRKLFSALFPPSEQKDSGNIVVGLATWLILISGTTFVSLIDAFH